MTIIRGKPTQGQHIVLEQGEVLKSLDNNQFGTLDSTNVDRQIGQPKQCWKNEYFRRIKLILKSELNSGNTINAINTYAVPSIVYGFQVIDWTITELDKVDRGTRRLLQQYHSLHIQSDVTRLYIPRRDGGRGLANICELFKNTIINFSIYLSNSNEELLTMALHWQQVRRDKSLHQRAAQYCDELSIDLDTIRLLSKETRKQRIQDGKDKQKVTRSDEESNAWPTPSALECPRNRWKTF